MNVGALASRQSQGLEADYGQGPRLCRFLVIIPLLYTVAPTVTLWHSAPFTEGVGGLWYKTLRKVSCPWRCDITVSTPTTRDSLEGKERTTVTQRAFESVKEAKSMVPEGDTQRGRKVQAGERESGSFLSTWVGDRDPGFLSS